MRRASLSALALIATIVTGCPRSMDPDTGGLDSGPDAGRDAPGGADARMDAPGRDVPTADVPRADTPPGDTPPAGCPEMDLGSMLGARLATGSTSGSTAPYAPECASGTPSRSRSFRWEAPSAGSFLIYTAGSSFDTALALLDDTCTGLERDCSDDIDADTTSRIALDAMAGEVFIIIVSGYDETESGDFVLSIEAGPAEETGLCNNGVDDDRDSQTDCRDFDCDGTPACIETLCADGMDNDGDGNVDCADFDCDGDPTCVERDCADGVDNERDGATDCDDRDCDRDPVCIENCSNMIDDDLNGDVDCLDVDCDRDPACMENCTNLVDDDMDGDADCDDAFCAMDPACFESDCANMLDDDMDGDADCLDFDCETSPACGGSTSCALILCGPGFMCVECARGAMCVPLGGDCP